ncbi:DUF3892 domain-containing protein [Serratia fonticola]|uniref:DUF3892 domain-containing protein n=1 Tax=Serratia fonticola TaxID=47917 RepID=UPI003AB0DD2B
MTNFYISCVRMDSKRQHIQYVKIIKAGKGVKQATINSRQFFAELITEGKANFKTITKNSKNDWVYGATVHVIDKVYITTEPNKTKRDNLGSFPTFLNTIKIRKESSLRAFFQIAEKVLAELI